MAKIQAGELHQGDLGQIPAVPPQPPGTWLGPGGLPPSRAPSCWGTGPRVLADGQSAYDKGQISEFWMQS